MRVRYQAAPHPVRINLVGVAGFEPATSCSQSRRDDRATLHPENWFANIEVKVALTNVNLYVFSYMIRFLWRNRIFRSTIEDSD
jgi:hypothetical protein